MARPMLGDLELQLVQQIDVEGDQGLVQHSIPALEGDFLQRIGRYAARVTLSGVLAGPEVADGLKALREKFQAAEPVDFVADITTATRVDSVLIEAFGVRELAGKPERFEYAFTLREYIAPPAVTTERPTPIPEPEEPEDPRPIDPPPPPDDDIRDEVGTLVVEVIVEGDPDFDFRRVTVTVQGTRRDGQALTQTLTNRADNIWREERFPAGQFTVMAVVNDDATMTGSAEAEVNPGATTQVTITLRATSGVIAKTFVVHFWFDKAFVEPCMRQVLAEVADYAAAHPDEKLLILGHTDLTGSDEYNQALSERRARSVYALLTNGRDLAGAQAELNELRQTRPSGTVNTVKDSWGVREQLYILQSLGLYSGPIKETEDQNTNQAVRDFQTSKGLTADGIVGDATWAALIDAYLAQNPLNVPESQFLPNAAEGCDGGILKWLGAGEKDPTRNTQDAWRPNRRAECLFVRADALPCPVPQPVTFGLPPGTVGGTWCLGPGNLNDRVCFAHPAQSPCPPDDQSKWCRQPDTLETITVSGSIRNADGSPFANARYVLIAPDGEYLATNSSGAAIPGENAAGANRGRPIISRADANGQFSYPLQKRAGIYTFELQENSPARLAEDPSGSARGVTLCKRLRAGVTFDVVAEAPGSVAPPTTQAVLTFVAENDPQVVIEEARIGDAVRLRADLPDATGDEVTIEIISLPIPGEGS